MKNLQNEDSYKINEVVNCRTMRIMFQTKLKEMIKLTKLWEFPIHTEVYYQRKIMYQTHFEPLNYPAKFHGNWPFLSNIFFVSILDPNPVLRIKYLIRFKSNLIS